MKIGDRVQLTGGYPDYKTIRGTIVDKCAMHDWFVVNLDVGDYSKRGEFYITNLVCHREGLGIIEK